LKDDLFEPKLTMKRENNILFVMPRLDTGGAERVMINIINHLNRANFNISLVLFNSDGLLMEHLNSDITVYNLKLSSVAKGIPKLLFTIYKIKPDILFSGIGNLNLYISIFIPIMRYILPNIRWIARQASILTLNNQAEKSPKMYEFLYKRVYKNYDKIVCQSQYMQRDLIENYNFPKEKSIVINNPIDNQNIERLSKEIIEYPFDKSSIKLISVGGLRYEKRHDLLLQAFAKLDNRYSLLIIGDGIKRDELKGLARELKIDKRVAFLGYIKNPYPFIQNADIFILTSKYEGFPNVLLEANLLGKPIVSFNSIGGVSEIIKNGINGILVPYKDIDALAKAIESINSKTFNSEIIRDMTIDKYSIDFIIKKYEFILKG